MATEQAPEAWIGQRVKIVWGGGTAKAQTRMAVLRDMNELGVTVETLESRIPSFYPWAAVREISPRPDEGGQEASSSVAMPTGVPRSEPGWGDIP